MYAITEISYCAIPGGGELLPGETLVQTVPTELVELIDSIGEQRRAKVLEMDAQAEMALSSLRAYRDLASPTNAQTVAVVRLPCRVAIVLLRHRLGRLDGTD